MRAMRKPDISPAKMRSPIPNMLRIDLRHKRKLEKTTKNNKE